VETTRRDYVDGVFIERVEWDDTVDDPAGGNISVHRVELRRLRFRLSTEPPELEFLDPPRSTRSFVAALQECAGSGLVVGELPVRPTTWLGALEVVAPRVRVTGLTTGALVLSSATAAFVRVEGTHDVREDLQRFLPKHNADADRLEVSWQLTSGPARCELLTMARAVIDATSPEDVVPVLRGALRAALRS
jgi:hypothetical protein